MEEIGKLMLNHRQRNGKYRNFQMWCDLGKLIIFFILVKENADVESKKFTKEVSHKILTEAITPELSDALVESVNKLLSFEEQDTAYVRNNFDPTFILFYPSSSVWTDKVHF